MAKDSLNKKNPYLSEPWRMEALKKVPLLASALAFQTILAVVPLIALTLWYLRSVGAVSKWADGFKQYIFDQMNVANNNALIEKVEKFVGGVESNSWGWIGLIVLVYTGMSLFFTLGRCFDFILETRGGSEKSRGVWAKISLLRRFFALPILTIMLSASVATMSWLKKDSIFRTLTNLKTVGPWIAKPLPWLLDWVGFFVIYTMIPREKVSLKYSARAALFAVPLYEGGKYLMQIYAKNSFATSKLYGALAVIPIFMIWIQLAWMILLGGLLTFPGPKKKLF